MSITARARATAATNWTYLTADPPALGWRKWLDDNLSDELNENSEFDSEQPPRIEAPNADSRRDVLREVGKKELYVMPVMLVLAAMPEPAWASAPASATCVVSGGACVGDTDCCSLSCHPGTMTCNMA